MPYFIAASAGGGILFLAVFVWVLVKTCAAAREKSAMFMPTSPGSLWSPGSSSANNERASLLSNAADGDWGARGGYVPPSGVV